MDSNRDRREHALSDVEFTAATDRIRRAKERYKHVDVGALAEEEALEYQRKEDARREVVGEKLLVVGLFFKRYFPYTITVVAFCIAIYFVA